MSGLMVCCASCGDKAEKKLFRFPPDGWVWVMMSASDDFVNMDNPEWRPAAAPVCGKCAEPIKKMFAPLAQKR